MQFCGEKKTKKTCDLRQFLLRMKWHYLIDGEQMQYVFLVLPNIYYPLYIKLNNTPGVNRIVFFLKARIGMSEKWKFSPSPDVTICIDTNLVVIGFLPSRLIWNYSSPIVLNKSEIPMRLNKNCRSFPWPKGYLVDKNQLHISDIIGAQFLWYPISY